MHRPVSARHLFTSSHLVSSRSCTCYSRNGLKSPIPLLFLYRSSCQAPPHTHIDKYISFSEYYTPKFANYQFVLIFCECNMLFAEQRMCLGTFSRLRRSLATSALYAAVRILAERFLLYRKAISCKAKNTPVREFSLTDVDQGIA